MEEEIGSHHFKILGDPLSSLEVVSGTVAGRTKTSSMVMSSMTRSAMATRISNLTRSLSPMAVLLPGRSELYSNTVTENARSVSVGWRSRLPVSPEVVHKPRWRGAGCTP